MTKYQNYMLYNEKCFVLIVGKHPLHKKGTHHTLNQTIQFNSHSSFLAGNPERARKTGINAMAPKEKATSGR